MPEGDGLFPSPGEIKLNCSCPDWAGMCKHVAAVLYGVGARLDEEPQFLFVLRGVDENELIANAGQGLPLSKATPGPAKVLDDSDVAACSGSRSPRLPARISPPPQAARAVQTAEGTSLLRRRPRRQRKTSHTRVPVQAEPKWVSLVRGPETARRSGGATVRMSTDMDACGCTCGRPARDLWYLTC